MSNPALNRMLRGGGLTSFHVGNLPSGRGDPHRLFAGEVVHSTFSATEYKKDMKDKKEHDFSKKEHREEKKKKSDSDSESDGEDDGPKTKKSKGDTSGKNGFPARGSDGDGDGKKNEPKKKMDWSDKNSNGKPDGMEKKK